MKSILMLSFVAFALVLGGCGKEATKEGPPAGTTGTPSGTPSGTPTGTPSKVPSSGTITSFDEIYTAPDRTTLLNRSVRLDRVECQALIGDAIFLAGPNPSQVLPVAKRWELQNKGEGLKIRKHHFYQIEGFVDNVSNPENPKKFWNLMKEPNKAIVRQAKVYISGEVISDLGPGFRDSDADSEDEAYDP